MVVYNYTHIKKRDKKIYSAFNTTISQSGIAFGTVKIAAAFLAIFSVFGLLFCLITGTFWYNPISLAKSSASGYFYLVFIIAPISLGVFTNTFKVQNYKLIDYLKIYFMPKHPIDHDGKRVKIEGYTQEGFVEII